MSHPALHLRPTDHAKLRWTERGSVTESITEAVDRAVPVGAENVSGHALLHEDTNTLIVYKEDEITTVLDAHDWELGDDHLPVCDDCGCRWDPSQTDECHWCE